MSVKLIASDFDGTIGRGEQLKRDVEAIEAFRNKGNLFGLISGRSVPGLRAVKERTGLPVDFLLSDSGGTCYIDGKLIFCIQAKKEAFFPLASFLLCRGSRLISVNRFDGSDMLYYRHSDGREEYGKPRCQWEERPFPQMSGLFEDYARCRKVANEAEALFPGLTALPNDDCLDVVPRGCSKAAGVARIAAHFGVEKSDVFTVGDNYNDLAMLDAYDSFVVAGAPAEVQEHATIAVVQSVAEMIEKLI